MVNEILSAIHHLLPDRIFILLPDKATPELVFYSEECKAVVRTDESLPVFVVINRLDGKMIAWGEGQTITDAARQAMTILEAMQQERRHAA
jgi:hypothetical protein